MSSDTRTRAAHALRRRSEADDPTTFLPRIDGYEVLGEPEVTPVGLVFEAVSRVSVPLPGRAIETVAADAPRLTLGRMLVREGECVSVILPPEDGAWAERSACLLRLLGALDTPHCTRFIDVGLTSELAPCFVVSRAPGWRLDEVLGHARPTAAQAVNVLVPVLGVVLELHAALVTLDSITMRDIAIDEDGAPVLTIESIRAHPDAPSCGSRRTGFDELAPDRLAEELRSWRAALTRNARELIELVAVGLGGTVDRVSPAVRDDLERLRARVRDSAEEESDEALRERVAAQLQRLREIAFKAAHPAGCPLDWSDRSTLPVEAELEAEQAAGLAQPRPGVARAPRVVARFAPGRGEPPDQRPGRGLWAIGPRHRVLLLVAVIMLGLAVAIALLNGARAAEHATAAPESGWSACSAHSSSCAAARVASEQAHAP